MVVTIVRASTNRLHDCVYQQPWLPSVHLGRLCPLRVQAVVFTVAVEELIREQLLYPVKQRFHEAGDLRLYGDFEYVEIFVGAQFLGVLVLFHLVERSLAQRYEFFALLGGHRLDDPVEAVIQDLLVGLVGRFLLRSLLRGCKVAIYHFSIIFFLKLIKLL